MASRGISLLLFAALIAAFAAGCFFPELKKTEQEEPDGCTACASAECGEAFAACFDSSACAQLVSCAFSCDPADDTCFATCAQNEQAALGLERALALADCTTASCPGACPAISGSSSGPGGSGGSGGSVPSTGSGGPGGSGGFGGGAGGQ